MANEFPETPHEARKARGAARSPDGSVGRPTGRAGTSGFGRELIGLSAVLALLFCLAVGAAFLFARAGTARAGTEPPGGQSSAGAPEGQSSTGGLARGTVPAPGTVQAVALPSFDARPLDARIDRSLKGIIERQVEFEDRPIHTSALDAAVEKIRDRLASAAGFKGGDVQFVVVRSSEVNAFALPGGVVLVTSGLIRALDNAEELAAVLGHELGHVAAHDPLHLLYGQIGIAILFSGISQTGAGDLARRALSTLARYHYSSSAERAADRFGMALCDRAGLPDDSFASALERLRTLPGSAALAWLDPHGLLTERIAAARAYRHDESRPRSGFGIDWSAVLAALP